MATTARCTFLTGYAWKGHGLASSVNDHSLALRRRANIDVRMMASRVKVEWNGDICRGNVVICGGCAAIRCS
jgi:hypothetical protein